jgi:hypothetical protein
MGPASATSGHLSIPTTLPPIHETGELPSSVYAEQELLVQDDDLFT